MCAKRISTLVLCALALCALGHADTGHDYEFTSSKQLTAPEYASELDHLTTLANQAIDNPSAAREAIDDLRGTWKVDANGQSFNISTGWLIDEFEKLQKNPTTSVRDNIIERLGAMKANAAGFQQEPADSSDARAKLTQILARSEFHQVHGPTWVDRLKIRILSGLFICSR